MGEKFAPRVNYFAGVPKHYELLIKRYEELFHVSIIIFSHGFSVRNLAMNTYYTFLNEGKSC